MVTSHAPLDVVDVLRGDRLARPALDPTIAGGLRAMLTDGVYDIIGPRLPHRPIVVRAASLRQAPRTLDLSQSPLGRLRGVLVHQLLRLLCVGFSVDDPYDDAVLAWRLVDGSNELVTAFERLDADDRARLAAEVRAHFSSLTSALGVIRPQWMPRCAVRATQRVAGGAVELRDLVDLMIGAPSNDVAATALLDVTTAPLGIGDERAMRYHALVHTLRTSTMPMRTATYSTATNEVWARDVDFALLARSVDDVLATLGELWTDQ
jgi:hypothetical protein